MKGNAMNRRRTQVEDSAKEIELYNDTLQQLKSIESQFKSPGEYVSTRLESVSLNEIRRELKALLASSQSQASALLKSLFSKAVPFNEMIETTIESIFPHKEVLQESLKQLEVTRTTVKAKRHEVKLYLARYGMMAYVKLALWTHMEASKHLDNVAEEILDSFKVYCKEEILERRNNPVHMVEALIQNIAKSAARQDPIMALERGRHNATHNWSLLEFVPKEISRVNGLLKKCLHYESAISTYLTEYFSVLEEADQEQYGLQIGRLEDSNKSNVEKVLEIEKFIDSTDFEQFRAEYDIAEVEKRSASLYSSLIELTEIFAHAAMSTLFGLYLERSKLQAEPGTEEVILEKINREIEQYISGLSSLIKGAEQLHRRAREEGENGDNSVAFVSTFSKVFVVPILNTFVNMLDQDQDLVMKASTPQYESAMFKKFVDLASVYLLDPSKSIAMQLLDDLSLYCRNNRFKVVCVFDAIAVALLNHIDKSFSSIYFPIYMDQFMENYKSYEALLERIELASGDHSHYLKWRGSSAPQNVSKCFSVGVICDNFIEDVTSVLNSAVKTNVEIPGVLHASRGKQFYAQPSAVLYDQVHVLFSHQSFFYHLMPQYLRGFSEMFTEYIKYLATLESSINSSRISMDGEQGSASGISITSATYVLHDLEIIVHSLKTGTVRNQKIVSDYQMRKSNGSHSTCTLTRTEADDNTAEEEGSMPSDPQDGQDGVPTPWSSVGIQSAYDGEIVNMVIKRIEFPLQVAYKRLLHLFKGKIQKGKEVHLALELLESYWKESAGNENTQDTSTELYVPPAESSDIKKMLNFTKESVAKMYNFFSSIHEQLDTIKYSLEDFVIHILYTSASCSLQFLQSMPSKFRAANRQDCSKPSNYVKYLVVPLISFKEFTAPSLSRELRCKIMTQTISRLSSEYRSQILKLIQTVQNLNQSLLNSKDQKVKEQGASFLIADVGMIMKQLNTDITEYVAQCETRLEIDLNHCEDLKRLKTCLAEVQSN